MLTESSQLEAAPRAARRAAVVALAVIALVIGLAAPAQAAAGPTARWRNPVNTTTLIPQNRQLNIDASASTSAIPGGLRFAWYVNDQLQSGQTGPTFSTQPLPYGNYLVKLTVTDAAGQSHSIQNLFKARPYHPFIIIRGPTIAKPWLVGESILYDMSPSLIENGNRTYWWTVNGVKVPGANGVAFRFYPKAPGTYEIKGWVRDAYGVTGSRAASPLTVYAQAPPVASFTPRTQGTMVVGEKLNLDARSSSSRIGGDLKYDWYERGNKYAGRDDPRIYLFWPTYAGRHRVTLVVTDRIGQTSRQDIVINVIGKKDPVATFTPGDSTVPVGTTLRFDASKSYDPDGGALKYWWTATGVSGVASTTTSHTQRFTRPGKYRVRLDVQDNEYVKSSKTVAITVNTPPVASFTPSRQLNYNVGELATFDGSASRDPDGGGLQYFWYVRGEKRAVSRSSKLSYRFPKEGKSAVQLVVKDSLGAESKQHVEVNVGNQAPVATFAPGARTVRKGTAITFDGSGSRDPAGGRLEYYWSVTGVKGTASRASKYAHRFNNEGAFGVQLIVKNRMGVTGKKWVQIKVVP